MRTARGALAATAFAGLLLTGFAAKSEVTAEIAQYGITAGREVPISQPDPDDRSLSPTRELRGVRYLENTDKVEARLCRRFGVTVLFTATPPDRLPLGVEVRVRHPKFTREDGATSVEDRFRTYLTGNSTYAGFSFDHAWELEPGPWEILLLHHGQELARQPFTVTAPPAGSPSSDCPPEGVS